MISFILFLIGWFIIGGIVLGVLEAVEPLGEDTGLYVGVVILWPLVIIGLIVFGTYYVTKKGTSTILKMFK